MIKLFSLGTLTTSKINIEVNCINLIVTYCLRQKKYEFIKNNRINVFLYEDESEDVEISGIKSTICNIKIYGDVASYYALPDSKKMQWLLEKSISALKTLFEKNNWDVNLLIEDQINIKDKLDIIELPLFDKIFKNKEKSKTIHIQVKPELHRNLFILYCTKSSGEVLHKEVFFEGLPHYFYWETLFKEAKWVSNNEFKIFSRSKEFSFLFNSTVGACILNIETKSKSIDEVRDELKEFTPDNMKWRKEMIK